MSEHMVVTDDDESDRALVWEARSGDRAAFGKLVERYHGIVYSLAYTLTGSVVQSEEVAQESFLTAWKRLPEMREPERFRGWLCGITRNYSRRVTLEHRFRPSPGLADLSGEDVPSGQPSPLDRIISREEERLLWRALSQIPMDYRLPLVLFYKEQKSIERVAHALALSEQNVRKKLSRGRRMLQEQVAALLESALSRTLSRKEAAAAIVAVLSGGQMGTADAAPEPRSASVRSRLGATVTKIALIAAVAIALPVAIVGHRHLRERTPARASVAAPVAGTVAPAVPIPFVTSAPGARGTSVDDPSGLTPPRHPPGSVVIRGFDFEDGLLPDIFRLGHVVPGPPRPGNQFAVMGTVMTWWQYRETGVMLDDDLATFRNSLVLSFDYWVGDGDGQLFVQIWDATRRGNHYGGVQPIIRHRWVHQTLRLASFADGKSPPMEEGDVLSNMKIFGGSVGGVPLYIDNIQFVDYPNEAAAAGTAGDPFAHAR